MMHELDLPQGIHLPFLKTHNQVVRPHVGGVNPYHVGFHLFQRIEREMGLEECFFVREVYHDIAAIRALMTYQDFADILEDEFQEMSAEGGQQKYDDPMFDDEGMRKMKYGESVKSKNKTFLKEQLERIGGGKY